MFHMRTEPFTPGVKHLQTLAILLLMPFLTFAAEDEESDGADEASRLSWYKIEIIVFSNQHDNATSEQWTIQTREYPATMVTIGPRMDEQLAPRSLNQLKILAADQQLAATGIDVIGVEENVSEFLFDDPNRNETNRSRSSLSGDLLEEDLMVGLIREHPEDVEAVRPDEIVIDIEDDSNTDVDEGIGDADESMADDPNDNGGQDDLQPSVDLLFQADPAYEAYRALPEKEFLLYAMASRISRSPNYRLLYHTSWLQPIQPVDQAVPILIQAGDQYDDHSELDGFVTISRARYLHIDTDLWFTTFIPRSGQASMIMPDNTLQYPQADRDLLKQHPAVNLFESRRNNYLPVQTYRMRQSRRMRSSTLHYLDHPAFSLLIRVEKFSFPESDPAIGQADLQQPPQLP
jgi:hypothetical protein